MNVSPFSSGSAVLSERNITWPLFSTLGWCLPGVRYLLVDVVIEDTDYKSFALNTIVTALRGQSLYEICNSKTQASCSTCIS